MLGPRLHDNRTTPSWDLNGFWGVCFHDNAVKPIPCWDDHDCMITATGNSSYTETFKAPYCSLDVVLKHPTAPPAGLMGQLHPSALAVETKLSWEGKTDELSSLGRCRVSGELLRYEIMKQSKGWSIKTTWKTTAQQHKHLYHQKEFRMHCSGHALLAGSGKGTQRFYSRRQCPSPHLIWVFCGRSVELKLSLTVFLMLRSEGPPREANHRQHDFKERNENKDWVFMAQRHPSALIRQQTDSLKGKARHCGTLWREHTGIWCKWFWQGTTQ